MDMVLVDGVYYTGWMRTVDAAKMLGVSSTWVRMLAKQGRLKYREPEGVGRGVTGYVLMYEIALRRQASVRRERQQQRYREHELEADAEWLSRKEAAVLLDVTECRIYRLAQNGTLRSKTTPHGTKRHRLFVLKRDAERLADNVEHRRRRFLWERDRKWAEPKPNPQEGIEPEGDWLTSADVAAWLGVSISCVCLWQKSGRLRCALQRGTGGKKWYRKTDVLELLANPEFQKHRAGRKKANPAAVEEAPSPAFRVLKTDEEFRRLSLGVGELW